MQYNFSDSLTPTEEAYQELQKAYAFFNQQLFGAALPNCLITFQRQKNSRGYFCSDRFVSRAGALTDEIALNPSKFAIRTIEEVLSTLVHEMVHLWQQRFGQPGRGRYHNEEWAEKMESTGLMPSDTGEVGGKRTGDRVSHYIIEGGPFSRACVEFLSSSRAVSWLDRYPDELVAVDSSLAGLLAPVKPKAETKNNRVKYSHECSDGGILSVWGKRSLPLACGRCGGHFNEELV